MHEPVPILCRACGAPVDEPEDVALRCHDCGTTDELPRDAHARVRELRRRIHARAASVVQLSAREATFAGIFEGGSARRSVVLPYVAIFGVVLLQGVMIPGPDFSARSLGQGMILANLLLAIPFAALVGLGFGRRAYRSGLRGLLHARPSRVPGGPARCRCCAAALPREHGPLLRCRHCHTHSLVTLELQARSAATLAEEVAEHRAQLELAGRDFKQIGVAMDTIFWIVTGGTYVLVLMLFQILTR